MRGNRARYECSYRSAANMELKSTLNRVYISVSSRGSARCIIYQSSSERVQSKDKFQRRNDKRAIFRAY